MDKHLENSVREINARRDSQLPETLTLSPARSEALRMLTSTPRNRTRGGGFQFAFGSRLIAHFAAPRIALRFAAACVLLCVVLYSARERLGNFSRDDAHAEAASPAAETWNGNEAVDPKEFQRRLASISMHSTAIGRSSGLLNVGVRVNAGLLDPGVEHTP